MDNKRQCGMAVRLPPTAVLDAQGHGCVHLPRRCHPHLAEEAVREALAHHRGVGEAGVQHEVLQPKAALSLVDEVELELEAELVARAVRPATAAATVPPAAPQRAVVPLETDAHPTPLAASQAHRARAVLLARRVLRERGRASHL
jgi:hypothetical protein